MLIFDGEKTNNKKSIPQKHAANQFYLLKNGALVNPPLSNNNSQTQANQFHLQKQWFSYPKHNHI